MTLGTGIRRQSKIRLCEKAETGLQSSIEVTEDDLFTLTFTLVFTWKQKFVDWVYSKSATAYPKLCGVNKIESMCFSCNITSNTKYRSDLKKILNIICISKYPVHCYWSFKFFYSHAHELLKHTIFGKNEKSKVLIKIWIESQKQRMYRLAFTFKLLLGM